MNREARDERRRLRRERRRENPLGRLIFGAGLITVGILFWLDRLGRIDASDYYHLWPILLIVFGGLTNFVQRKWIAGGIWTLVGVAFLTEDSGWEVLRIAISVWPLLISLAGITLIVQAFRASRDPNAFRAAAVMAGNVRTVAASGSAVAVMGGCMVDFSAAKETAGDFVIDVLAFWGGIEIRVPEGWRVEDNVFQIFGGFEDKTGAPRENAPRLLVRGSAIMGGVEVKTAAGAAA